MAGPRLKSFSRLPRVGATSSTSTAGSRSRFLRAGLIQRLIITRVPVLIGEGNSSLRNAPESLNRATFRLRT